MQEQTTHIPKFSYPFKKIINSKECFKSLAGKDEGNYLFTSQGFWHGGLHFNNSFGEEIRAIADGEIVAYRINDKYLEDEKGIYSTGFFLIKHYFEYPLNNKLTFFSLYMHTAKKEDYCIKITGSKRHLRSGYENSLNSEAIGEELNLDTNIIIDGNWKKNRAKVLFIENQTIDLTQELTIHKSNVTKENNIEYFKDIAKILNRNIVNQVDILEKPIKIKAGEIIGLMGEYNVSKNTNTKVLHLEVFTKDDIKSFSEKAKEYCEKLAVKKEEKLPPISFDWAKIIEIKSNDKISILEKLENLIIPKLQKNGAKLNSSYEELFKLIDNDNNKELDQQEIKDAAKNEIIKITTSNYIVKHSSEWDITTNMADVLLEISSKYKNELDEDDINREKERIKKLSFFSECKIITDFPQSDEVFHLNAIGLVGAFKKDGCLSMDKFTQFFPNAPEEKKQEVLEVFNKYCQAFEINTPLRVAHFFAQVKEEVGETINYKNESLNYSIDSLKYGDFKYFRNNHEEAEIYGRGNGHSANPEAIANRAYGNRNDLGNGDVASGDGWSFRGKGFLQLTGRTNYENANKEIQERAANSNIDIITNPESILTIKGAMVSSMAYWTMNRLNTKADNAGWDKEKVDTITDVVNYKTSSRKNRKENFDLIQNILNN